VKLTAENHDTALHLAAYAGNVDVVDTVLDYCAKIDACNEVEPRVVWCDVEEQRRRVYLVRRSMVKLL
jgi:hypothetical protein